MLKIFEQIFHGEQRLARGYSDELINRAIERAVDATDPRVRILPGYKKQMRSSVITAIDHILQLVDALAPPVPMSHDDWCKQVVMNAMFASGESLQTVLQRDAACRDFLMENRMNNIPVTALLLAQRSQKSVYGFDLIDDLVVSDVPLTVVSFDEHRLTGLATDETETQRRLKLRAFDYLLVLALEKITSIQDRRQDLVVRRKLLRTKLDILARSSGNLAQQPGAITLQDLQKKMDQVESELHEMGADDGVLKQHLQLIINMLGAAAQKLWLENTTLHLDNMHYLRSADDPKAAAVPLQLLRDANGREMVAQMVVLPAGVLVSDRITTPQKRGSTQ
jgi:hypothetical protein